MGKKEWNAQDLFHISGSYWAACVLQSAVELELFTALAQGPRQEEELAAALGCNSRSFAMLITTLCAMELLERKDDLLCAPERVLSLLSKNAPDYIGFIIQHHADIMPAWSKLTQAVRTGQCTREGSSNKEKTSEEREAFLMGMFNIARLQADRIAAALDLRNSARLIDIGGGPGTYAIYFCRKNPQLRATIFDLPSTEPFARRVVEQYGLTGRVDFVAGNFLRDTLPVGQDVAWLSQVVHGERPEDAAMLIRKAAACLNPGGRIAIQEFMLDDDRNGPEHAALFSLNMLVQTDGGQAYAKAELTEMLNAAGARSVSTLELALPNSCRVIVGEMA